jgi:hypothetical protein
MENIQITGKPGRKKQRYAYYYCEYSWEIRYLSSATENIIVTDIIDTNHNVHEEMNIWGGCNPRG